MTTVNTGGSFLGHRVKRTEDRALITGAGDYTADLDVPGALHAVFVRSPLAHGVLRGLEVDEARGRPGVKAVLTAADLDLADRDETPGTLPRHWRARSWPATASGSSGTSWPWSSRTPPPTRSGRPSPSRSTSTRSRRWSTSRPPSTTAPRCCTRSTGSNLAAASSTGEVEGLFDDVDVDVDVVVAERFRIQRVAGVPMEPNACVAVPGDTGDTLTLWLSTQAPHAARTGIAADLGIEPEKVRVVNARVGGGFGPKAYNYTEWTIVARAALALGAPVRWSETRSENMVSMVHGRRQVQDVEIGLTAQGRIVGLRARVLGDAGAYPSLGCILPSLTSR